MLCLSGFELHSRWMPLSYLLVLWRPVNWCMSQTRLDPRPWSWPQVKDSTPPPPPPPIFFHVPFSATKNEIPFIYLVLQRSQGCNRDLQMPRRRRQQERQKSNSLNRQNKNVLYIFCRHCTTTTGECLISRFMEDVNKGGLNFLFLSKLQEYCS